MNEVCHICKCNIDGHFHLDDQDNIVDSISTTMLNKEEAYRFLQALESQKEPTEALKEVMKRLSNFYDALK